MMFREQCQQIGLSVRSWQYGMQVPPHSQISDGDSCLPCKCKQVCNKGFLQSAPALLAIDWVCYNEQDISAASFQHARTMREVWFPLNFIKQTILCRVALVAVHKIWMTYRASGWRLFN